MDAQAIKLAAIDDDPQCLELIAESLEQPGLAILTSSDAEAGLALALREHAQIVLVDMVMPKLSGIQVLQRLVEADPAIDVLLMTAHYSAESAVEAIQKGACDYITKPLSIAGLRQRIDELLTEHRRRQRAGQLERELVRESEFEGMVGRSPLLLDVFARIRRVAPHFRTALVLGRTGSGKELAARALHALSPAASGPFVACNCSAVTETLFESELFGYVKGAFTGAQKDKLGLFEYASGGTLLLDEIGDMPLATQGKLLRVLQNQEVQRVGSPAARKVDVRVVAATNRDLHELMAAKQFREDLYYRLSMVEVRLPSLADRKEDLPLLVRHFIDHFSAQYNRPIHGITRRAQAVLTRYSWPGNIRELENVIGDASMNVEGDTIDVGDLPERLRVPTGPAFEEDEGMIPLAELDRRHARRVLERCGGNKVRAAEVLGISRATLYRLLGEAEASRA